MIQIELASGHELDALSAVLELPKRDGMETDDAYRARLRACYLRKSTTKTDCELLELLVALKRAADALEHIEKCPVDGDCEQCRVNAGIEAHAARVAIAQATWGAESMKSLG